MYQKMLNVGSQEYAGFFILKLIAYLAVLGLSCNMWIQFPKQGSNLDPLHWESRVLVTGPPGKFQECVVYSKSILGSNLSPKEKDISQALIQKGVFFLYQKRGDSTLSKSSWENPSPQYPTCHPLSPSSPTLNLSQHQGLFQGVRFSHQVAQVLELQFQSF